MSMAEEVSIIYATVNGFLDDVPVNKVQDFEAAFHKFIASNHPEIHSGLTEKREITPDIDEQLRTAIREFKETVPY
jgi:F-type H+-transporting ATPase subunit alpha